MIAEKFERLLARKAFGRNYFWQKLLRARIKDMEIMHVIQLQSSTHGDNDAARATQEQRFV